MNTFIVNGVTYTAKPFDFNMVCDLEDMGISMQDAENKPMSLVRAYFALCIGKGNIYAGKEMESHIINGGDFTDVMNAMSKEMAESDFFRNLNKNEEKEVTKTSRAKKKDTEI